MDYRKLEKEMNLELEDRIKLQEFATEVRINIFKYVDSPLSLALSCRSWYNIAKDKYAKFQWLLEHYKEAHALFHAVRLGHTFIDEELCEALIKKQIPLSESFVRRLIKFCGKEDQRLNQLKGKESNEVKHWGSGLPTPVLERLFKEGCKQLLNANEDSEDDRELFAKLEVPQLAQHTYVVVIPQTAYGTEMLDGIPFP